jgi:hypothetical protein
MNNYPDYRKFHNPNNPTARWAKELLEDEVAGLKTIKVSLQVFDKVKEISNSQEAATFDSVLIEALDALKIQKEIGPQTLESIVTNDSEE